MQLKTEAKHSQLLQLYNSYRGYVLLSVTMSSTILKKKKACATTSPSSSPSPLGVASPYLRPANKPCIITIIPYSPWQRYHSYWTMTRDWFGLECKCVGATIQLWSKGRGSGGLV